ncbi:hypothetical protein FRC03_011663 [Tulasnella sp. 419]|nr:hypothetical protein FRC03_011663 [Tulasnella sp. 419]
MSTLLYSYPSSNPHLIKDLELERHIEGGYFRQTSIYDEKVPSPLAGNESRPLATTIYYLLTADEPRGYFHRNKSHTMHVLHQGRARYTLINPRPSDATGKWTPEMTYATMGENQEAEETRQLFVAGGVWKMSTIPDEDLNLVKESKAKGEKVGCLISEVVTPGFVWQDHEWMTMDTLKELFKDAENGEEMIEKLSKFVRPVE